MNFNKDYYEHMAASIVNTNYMNSPNPSASANNGTSFYTGDTTLSATGYTNCINSLNFNTRANNGTFFGTRDTISSASGDTNFINSPNARYYTKKKLESKQSADKIKELEKTVEDLKKENSNLRTVINVLLDGQLEGNSNLRAVINELFADRPEGR
ncbi:19226_t:CDS:2 [Gigaspora margarita]|uniref:19226_t:CDS:1 n=1 Tax=Gigaspora margarita TaxID=4874 RepID=A0ABN7W8G3_GIGMA|nr:19226_t:CDS:2 [Gigaspora margarita]